MLSFRVLKLGISRKWLYEPLGSFKHLVSKLQAVPMGTNLISEMEINRVFEKKGHEFVDVNVNLFDENDGSCMMSINLVAIYKLRGT